MPALLRLFACLAACLSLLSTNTPLPAADWPTYRGDVARTGATAEELGNSVVHRWTYQAAATPRLAWSSAEGRVIEGHLIGHRVKFDDALHPVVVGQRVYFGSTVDHQVHCLDLASGAVHWTHMTGGPIRLAPTVWEGRVYVGSDDGHVTCLDAERGTLLWTRRAGPREDWLLARGEMISRWPVRTGVLVDDGVAYFGAGIFPHEDVFLYAVDARSGEVLWRQDNVSDLDAGRNDLSPQGYLLTEGDRLFVPSGRSLPAAFDRRTGEFLFKRTHSWRSTAGGVVGGTRAILADGQLYASGPHHMVALDQRTGDVGFGWFQGRQIVVQGNDAFSASGTELARFDRAAYAVASGKRLKLELEINALARKLTGDEADASRLAIQAKRDELQELADVGVPWSVPATDESALLAAGRHVLLGGKNRVTAYEAASGKSVWTITLDGDARGLVVANGSLLVSTDTGAIHSFAMSDAVPAVQPETIALSRPAPAKNPEQPVSDAHRRFAESVVEQTGIRRGFCLVVNGGAGELALELARLTELKIYMTETDPSRMESARKRLLDAGYYGHRVTVHRFDPQSLPYANFFANLIVSGQLPDSGGAETKWSSVARHLKPMGGLMITGPSHAPGAPDPQAALTDLVREAGLDAAELTSRDTAEFTLLTRGKLPGAGDWSHQYGNAANTAVNDETRVSGDLSVLWYGDPGPGDMVNRHDGAVGPLTVQGRLIVQGESTVKAYDAYNGLHLWTFENPEAVRTGVFQNENPGNLAASGDRVFHFQGDLCHELHAATGELVRTHRLPPARDAGAHQWGYVAVQDNLLIGTATMRREIESAQRRRGRATIDATDSIFAIDLSTGQPLWEYQGQSISHHTIAVAPNRICFIDSSVTGEQRQELLRQDKSHLIGLTGQARALAEERLKTADVRMAVALDVRTGQRLWAEPVDVTDCSEVGIGGGNLTMMYAHGVLLLGGANANGHFWEQFVNGEFARRRLVALSAEDGYKLWAKDANYRHRPIIVGEQVLAEPWMYDLQTGEQLMRPHPVTGKQEPWSIMRTGHHCGMLTGCESGMLLFRSGDTAFYDLQQDAGTRHFSGHRLGCWINAIPAAGLVMIPEASAGCVCQFSIAATIVLEPRSELRSPWAIYSAVGAQTPVKHLAINLGAPGDRKDDAQITWLSYPRYQAYKETSLDLDIDLRPQFLEGGRFRSVSEASTTVTGTQTPWLYTSWAEGLASLTLDVLGPQDAPRAYDVRLHFATVATPESSPARFDVRLNGQIVLTDVTLSAPQAASGSADAQAAEAIVRQIDNVPVTDELLIELVPREGQPRLSAVEVMHRE
jgi:outer membrane protein assembly factor BamB